MTKPTKQEHRDASAIFNIAIGLQAWIEGAASTHQVDFRLILSAAHSQIVAELINAVGPEEAARAMRQTADLIEAGKMRREPRLDRMRPQGHA